MASPPAVAQLAATGSEHASSGSLGLSPEQPPPGAAKDPEVQVPHKDTNVDQSKVTPCAPARNSDAEASESAAGAQKKALARTAAQVQAEGAMETHSIGSMKRSAAKAAERDDDALSAHSEQSAADNEAALLRAKVKRLQAKAAAADAHDELAEAEEAMVAHDVKVASSSGSNKSRSERGARSSKDTRPPHGIVDPKLAVKMAERRRIVDIHASPASPLGHIDEGRVALVPPSLPSMPTFPNRVPTSEDVAPLSVVHLETSRLVSTATRPMPEGVARNLERIAGPGPGELEDKTSSRPVRDPAPLDTASTLPQPNGPRTVAADDSDKSVDVDAYARAGSVQKSQMLKQQSRPPVPARSGTPRGSRAGSVASSSH